MRRAVAGRSLVGRALTRSGPKWPDLRSAEKRPVPAAKAAGAAAKAAVPDQRARSSGIGRLGHQRALI